MKVIELKVLPRTSDTNPEVNYRTALLTTVRSGGTSVTMDVVRKSLHLLELLEETSDGADLSLNDDEYSVLMMRLANATWSGVCANLVQFFDDVEHAKARSRNGKSDGEDEVGAAT